MADRSKRGRASTPAFTALTAAGVHFTAHEYEHDPRTESYGLEAAAALGVAAERVLKTLLADVDGELCVAVIPVSASLDLKALAAALGGKKARMAEAGRAERATGYVVGGISALGQRQRHRTVVDSSAADCPTVFVSAGRRGLEAELAPAILVELTGATTAVITR